MKYTKADADFVRGLVKDLNSGAKTIRRPIVQCKRLSVLMGKDPSGWDLMRDEFKHAYPLEAHNVRAALNTIKARLRKHKLKLKEEDNE